MEIEEDDNQKNSSSHKKSVLRKIAGNQEVKNS
jgi:hypothetical protein